MAAAKVKTAGKKTTRKKTTRKKTTGSSAPRKAAGADVEFGPAEWMALFAAVEKDSAGETDLQTRLDIWLTGEIQRLEDHRDGVRRLLTAGLDPREQTGIQLGINAGEAIQAFDSALKSAIEEGHFELYPWVMPTYAAVAIQSLRVAGLTFWLSVGQGAEEYVERSLSLLVRSLGRAT